MTRTIYVRASIHQTRSVLRQLPAIISGNSPIGQDASRALALRLGVECMSFQKQAYLTKARGGTDEAGVKWAPLSGYTIMKRLQKGKGRRGIQYGVKIERAFRRYQKAKEAYIATAKRLGGFSKRVKRSTVAKTKAKLEKLDLRLKLAKQRWEKAEANLQAAIAGIEILRDTGRLYNSLSPGESGQIKPDGFLEVEPGVAVVGTNVEYAPDHMQGRGFGHPNGPPMPARPPLVDPALWPASWWNRLTNAATHGIADLTATILAGGAL